MRPKPISKSCQARFGAKFWRLSEDSKRARNPLTQILQRGRNISTESGLPNIDSSYRASERQRQILVTRILHRSSAYSGLEPRL